MLEPNNTILVLIDAQAKLTAVMHDRDELVSNLVKLVKGIQLLKVPILWLEQNPDKMGSTIPELGELLAGQTPITKMGFSCCGVEPFDTQLLNSGRKQVLIAGIETHVCVYQTAAARRRAP